ncbi:hypothetical protein [Streptomyces sp. NPDC059861]
MTRRPTAVAVAGSNALDHNLITDLLVTTTITKSGLRRRGE